MVACSPVFFHALGWSPSTVRLYFGAIRFRRPVGTHPKARYMLPTSFSWRRLSRVRAQNPGTRLPLGNLGSLQVGPHSTLISSASYDSRPLALLPCRWSRKSRRAIPQFQPVCTLPRNRTYWARCSVVLPCPPWGPLHLPACFGFYSIRLLGGFRTHFGGPSRRPVSALSLDPPFGGLSSILQKILVKSRT